MITHWRRHTRWLLPTPFGRSVLRRLFSSDKSKGPVVASSSLDESTTTAALRDKLLKAPFQRVVGTVNRPPFFPWRHSSETLPRLDPKSPEFYTKGQLIGGNIHSTHPLLEGMLTAGIFMNVPWYKMIFFNEWRDDLADNMSWAFLRGLSGILSNVYQVPMDKLSNVEGALTFDPGANEYKKNESPSETDDDSRILDNVDSMVEQSLRKLYQSAHEFGKDNLQVRLECRPTNARIENLFAFPFLSRDAMKENPALKEQYKQMINMSSVSLQETIPIYQELMSPMLERGSAESTIICQVLIECEEIFWVKDLSTGTVLQGYEDEKFRTVSHLVRFEMAVKTVVRNNRFFGFENIPGSWQITDIDDHLDGNLLL